MRRSIIRFVNANANPSVPTWHGYVYGVLMLVVAMTQSILQNQFIHLSLIVGMRIRSALIAVLYKKVCPACRISVLFAKIESSPVWEISCLAEPIYDLINSQFLCNKCLKPVTIQYLFAGVELNVEHK